MSHSERVRELERAVVEAAVTLVDEANPARVGSYDYSDTDPLEAAVFALLAACADTCEKCGGDGDTMKAIGDCGVGVYPCHAGCDGGRRRTT